MVSVFDEKVVAWIRNAKVSPDEKLALLEWSEAGIPQYCELVSKANYCSLSSSRGGLPILNEINQMKARITRGGDDMDDSVGKLTVNFKFGDTEIFEDEVEEEEDDEGTAPAPVAETSDEVHQYMAEQMKKGSRRKTVSSEVIILEDIDHFEPPVHEKNEEDTVWLTRVLEGEYLFEHLEDNELLTLVKAMSCQEFNKGDHVFSEGEEGDTFFVIQDGIVDIVEKGEHKGTATEGACLGEEELMYSAEARQTVTVSSATLKTWCLDRQTYRHIVTKASMKKRKMYEDFLSKISFLQRLSSFERLQVADALKPAVYRKGDKIIKFGEEGTHFHIIVEGTVRVVGRKDDREDGEPTEVCEFTTGGCVGELEFLNKHRTVADVVAATDEVRTARMGRRHFEKLMGPVSDFLQERAQGDPDFEYYRKKQEQIATTNGS